MSSNQQACGPCPLAWGDRVDHPKFGFGKIVSEPIAMVGPISDPQSLGGYRLGSKGWRMDVEWEDEGRGTSSMSSEFLTLEERPDAKGGLFWANEYEKLLTEVQQDRSKTQDHMRRAFRGLDNNPSDTAKIRESVEREKASLDALLAFLDADEAGKHL